MLCLRLSAPSYLVWCQAGLWSDGQSSRSSQQTSRIQTFHLIGLLKHISNRTRIVLWNIYDLAFWRSGRVFCNALLWEIFGGWYCLEIQAPFITIFVSLVLFLFWVWKTRSDWWMVPRDEVADLPRDVPVSKLRKQRWKDASLVLVCSFILFLSQISHHHWSGWLKSR